VKEQGRHDGVLALQGFFFFKKIYKFGCRTDMKVIKNIPLNFLVLSYREIWRFIKIK